MCLSSKTVAASGSRSRLRRSLPRLSRLIAANSRIMREVHPSDLHVADETANNRGGNAGSLSIPQYHTAPGRTGHGSEKPDKSWLRAERLLALHLEPTSG